MYAGGIGQKNTTLQLTNLELKRRKSLGLELGKMMVIGEMEMLEG